MKLYGWYSATGAKWNGTVVWTNPEGKEINLTEVTNDTEQPLSTWDDLVHMGEVVNFVHSEIIKCWSESSHPNQS